MEILSAEAEAELRTAIAAESTRLVLAVTKYEDQLRDGTVQVLNRKPLQGVWDVLVREDGYGFVSHSFNVIKGTRVMVIVRPGGSVGVNENSARLGHMHGDIIETSFDLVAGQPGSVVDRLAEVGTPSSLSLAELREVVADLADGFLTAERKRWLASDPLFPKLERLILMLGVAYNPHMILRGSALENTMPETERKALIGTLKLAMREFLKLAQADQKLKFSAFAKAVEGLEDDFFSVAAAMEAAPEELGAGWSMEELREAFRKEGIEWVDRQDGGDGDGGGGGGAETWTVW